MPLVAAGIIWGWLLALQGLINQLLSAIGLADVTRAWLGDFDTALPAVGIIGIWVLLGFCIVLLLTGMTKVDAGLYESARIDGASWFQELRAITIPSLRYEIGVCLTVTIIAALAAFDIVYVSTAGGPGTATTVPGIQIYYTAFLERQVGLASALAVALMVLVLVDHRPAPAPDTRRRPMRIARTELYAGRALLLALMALTILPFLSVFTTALHPSGTLPSGLDWPADPQWGNFVEAFNVSNMTALLASSVFIVVAVVPISLVISTMAGFAIGLLRIPGSRFLLLLFVFGLTLPFEGIITPLYYLARAMGILNTRLAIVLPLIGLFMPFAVFWMRAHFVNMPGEVSEAAKVDGAGTWDLFWRIHVPLARAPMVSLGILMSIWAWNQFLLALVLVEDPTQRTMAGALGAFQGHYATDIPLLCAGTILILLPTLLLFVLFQRHIITALLQGSVKG